MRTNSKYALRRLIMYTTKPLRSLLLILIAGCAMNTQPNNTVAPPKTTELVVEERIGRYNSVIYSFQSIVINPTQYILTINVRYSPSLDDLYGPNPNSRSWRVDNIFCDIMHLPVETKSYTLGKSKSVSLAKKTAQFRVIVPRAAEWVNFVGMGKYNNSGTVNLSRFDQYIPSEQPAPVTPRFVEDNSAPLITLTSPILVQNIHRTLAPFINISGTMTDEEGIALITINGQGTRLKKDGSFTGLVRLELGKNTIPIRAVDINDNVSEIEFYVIREEFAEGEEIADVDYPPKTNIKNRNGIAVVFGIESYLYAPPVSFALNDADIFREYLIKVFGIKRENIYFKTNERATKGEFEKVFSKNGWISNNSTEKTDLFIFYAGHGAPDLRSKQTYLIPYDIDPNYATTGYALNELYQNLGQLDVNSITVLLDACFTGVSRDNRPLLADSRPIYISVEETQVPNNTIVFTAASGVEISSAYISKMHGLFTYFFLKGLNGYADRDANRQITIEEMQEYLLENVSTQARKMGREQHPQILGIEQNRVLVQY